MPWFLGCAMIFQEFQEQKFQGKCAMITCKNAMVLGQLSLKIAIGQIQKMPCQKFQKSTLPKYIETSGVD